MRLLEGVSGDIRMRYTTKLHADATNMLKCSTKKFSSVFDIAERVKSVDSGVYTTEQLAMDQAELQKWEDAMASFRKAMQTIVQVASSFS